MSIKSHRFRAVDKAGLFGLAKDVTRLTADSIDAAAIQTIICPPKGTCWGSLKSLEYLLATRVDPQLARSMLTSLVGIYELRLGDAHLPSSDINEALTMIGIDSSLPYVHQGYQLLNSCVSSIYEITGLLERWGEKAD